jgi:hypothetical protein
MAFTRFHDDPNRIHKQLQQTTYIGQYQLNTPGNGLNLPFAEETQLRLQGWGANYDGKMISQENDLRGLTRKLNKDYIDMNDYKKFEQLPTTPSYRNENPYVEESRASHPAWMYKDLEQPRWENPFINPQNNFEIPFAYEVQTRILEKNKHVTHVPDLSIISGNIHSQN